MSPDSVNPRQISLNQLTNMADRFRGWTRTEAGAAVCGGVAEGNFGAENDLIAAFIWAVDPGEEHRVAS